MLQKLCFADEGGEAIQAIPNPPGKPLGSQSRKRPAAAGEQTAQPGKRPKPTSGKAAAIPQPAHKTRGHHLLQRAAAAAAKTKIEKRKRDEEDEGDDEEYLQAPAEADNSDDDDEVSPRRRQRR